MIADTSFLIDIMKSDKDAIRKAEEIEKKGTAEEIKEDEKCPTQIQISSWQLRTLMTD